MTSHLHSGANDDRKSRRRFSVPLLSLAVQLFGTIKPHQALAQSMSHPSDVIQIGAQAIGVVTHESPAIHGRDLTEGYLTQPVVMVRASPWRELLVLNATINFEGATVERGELNAGIYGEGYIDRRHPHTYLHELMLTSANRFRTNGVSGISVAAGKGFAPFGTDDPMSRPFEKYPVNHHLAQILERAVAMGAVRADRWILEAGIFNGDEPTSAGDAPNRKRYFDSWSARATFVPWPQGEFQASYARVKSPENATGDGADQRKHSASVRLEDAQHSGYALLEWARTADYVGSARTFAYQSILVETWAKYDLFTGALKLERTDRPDEQRLSDEFRVAVPAPDLTIAGRSRWTILTARLAASLSFRRSLMVEPFVEAARARVSPTLRPSGFDPRQFYGSDRIWSFSLGAKVAIGMSHMRMGRYGVAIPTRHRSTMAETHMEEM